MKKILLITFTFLTILSAQAQTFWTETFGTGCNQGNLASGYTGSNGAWSVTATGVNNSYADQWFVSGTANNTGIGNCGDYCSAGTDRTLHVGNAALPTFGIGADTLSTYLTGVFCVIGICSETHMRVESPLINCTGKSGISVSFIYYENGEGAEDDARLWFYDGTTWSEIDQLAKAAICNPFGIWTAFSLPLPSSADNNPSVKIGFNWTNDNDATGADPSFAVDDITLSTPSSLPGIYSSGNILIYTVDKTIVVNSNAPYRIISVSDIAGRSISYKQSDNVISLDHAGNGIYFLQLEINGYKITRKIVLK
ncbi:MAG TPA: T9SS type A sorting domain-containing protein [Bacteroidia bacterium]|nr:T9SS type A sorting domain-containing protein [Bacteroidia bacterium]